MNNKLRAILAVIPVALVLASCGHSHSHDEKAGTENNAVGHAAHEEEASESIELNNGGKWLVNEEMKPFVLESERILQHYMQTGAEDHHTLANQLKEKNEGLIKSCTMDGKSHDELHKWLHPHMQLIASLEKAESKDEANRIVGEIKTSFDTYHTYFQ